MKKNILVFLIALCLTSCIKNTIESEVESVVEKYASCNTQEDFNKWLYEIGSEGTTIVDNGITYAIFRTYDPTNSEVGLHIEINDGVADYHKDEVLNELEVKIKDVLKNHSITEAVYIDFGCVLVRMKNESNFNNID